MGVKRLERQHRITLGLVGHSRDFAFSSDGMRGQWSALSRRMTPLDIFKRISLAAVMRIILKVQLQGDQL